MSKIEGFHYVVHLCLFLKWLTNWLAEYHFVSTFHVFSPPEPELPPTTTSTASTTMGSVPITTEGDTVTPPEITTGPTVSSEGTPLSNEPTSMLIDTTADTTRSVPLTTVADTVLPREGTNPPTDARLSTNTTGVPAEGADAGVTAAVVVIVLILLIVSGVIAAVLIVLLTKKHRLSKRAYNAGCIQDGIGGFMHALVTMI